MAQKIEQMELQLAESRNREKALKANYFELLEKYHKEEELDKDSTAVLLLDIVKKHLLSEQEKANSTPSTLMKLLEDKIKSSPKLKQQVQASEPAKQRSDSPNSVGYEDATSIHFTDQNQSLVRVSSKHQKGVVSCLSKVNPMRSSKSVVDVQPIDSFRKNIKPEVHPSLTKPVKSGAINPARVFTGKKESLAMSTFQLNTQDSSTLQNNRKITNNSDKLDKSKENIKVDKKLIKNASQATKIDNTPCRDNQEELTPVNKAKNILSNEGDTKCPSNNCLSPKIRAKAEQIVSALNLRNSSSKRSLKSSNSIDKSRLGRSKISANRDDSINGSSRKLTIPGSTGIQKKLCQVLPGSYTSSRKNVYLGSRLASLATHETVRRDIAKEAYFCAASKKQPQTKSPLERKASIQQTQTDGSQSQLLQSGGSNNSKVPKINIHLSSKDHHDVECIEIDSSLPDKCFIKFVRKAASPSRAGSPTTINNLSSCRIDQKATFRHNISIREDERDSNGDEPSERDPPCSVPTKLGIGRKPGILQSKDLNRMNTSGQQLNTSSSQLNISGHNIYSKKILLQKGSSRGVLHEVGSGMRPREREGSQQAKAAVQDVEKVQQHLVEKFKKFSHLYSGRQY